MALYIGAKMKTFEDWKKIYYPISAEELVDSLEDEPNITKVNIELTKHDLQKWKGIRFEVLAEFRLQLNLEESSHFIWQAFDILTLDGSSCALCQKHINCESCPLNKQYYCGFTDSPYTKFCDSGNPEPLIQALEETLADLEHQHEEMTRK